MEEVSLCHRLWNLRGRWYIPCALCTYLGQWFFLASKEIHLFICALLLSGKLPDSEYVHRDCYQSLDLRRRIDHGQVHLLISRLKLKMDCNSKELQLHILWQRNIYWTRRASNIGRFRELELRLIQKSFPLSSSTRTTIIYHPSWPCCRWIFPSWLELKVGEDLPWLAPAGDMGLDW